MMSDEEEKILSIKVKYEDAINGIAKYNAAIQSVKEQQKKWREELKAGDMSQQEYNADMAASKSTITEYKDNIRVLEKEIQNNIKVQKEQEGSLKGLRAELSNMTKKYDEMSQAERSGAKGKELESHINGVTNELKKAEEETQRYYRNVGNYEDSIKSALGGESKWYKSLQSISGIMSGGVSNAFNVAGKAVSSFGKQLLKLLVNPIVAILAAIAVAIMAVVKSIKSSEENTNKLSLILAPFKRLLNEIISVIQTVCGWILTWVSDGMKLLGWIGDMCEKLPVIGKYIKNINDEMKDNIELQKQKIEIEEKSRQYKVQNAKDALDVAKLRNKAADREKYNANQRLSFLKRANSLEEEQMKRNVDLAERKYRVLKSESEQTQNNKAVNDELADAEANLYNARKDYYTGSIRLMREISTERQNIISDEKAKAKEGASETKRRAKQRLSDLKDEKRKEKEAVREAEDALYDLLSDNVEKQRERVAVGYDRQISDLKDKLATETHLTMKARRSMNDEIVTLEKEKDKKLQEYDNNEIAKKIENEEKNIELMLQAVKKGSDREYQLKYDLLEEEKKAEMHEAEIEIATEEEKNNRKWAIAQKYNLLFDEVYNQQANDRIKKEEDALQKSFEKRILLAGSDEEQELKLKAEQKKEELDSLQRLEGESIDDFNLRKLKKQREYGDAKKALDDKEIEIEKSKYEAISNIVGGLANLADALGEKNKTFAKLSKVLALAQIAINTGEAISAGIATASHKKPFSAMLVAIATTVATVLANMATAIKIVKGAKFATGGVVNGSGTETSDSVPARLSNGESVMTAAATSMFAPVLSTFNQIGGGVPIVVANNSPSMGEEMLANAIAKGFMKAPAPVVSVEEFTQVSNRVKYIESLGNI